MEGSTDPEEWACRFKTAAAIVAEASRRTADDLYFGAVVEGIEARKEESAPSETDDKDVTTGEGPSSGASPTEDTSVGDDEAFARDNLLQRLHRRRIHRCQRKSDRSRIKPHHPHGRLDRHGVRIQ